MSISTSMPGARLGKYRLLSHIAAGGMGMVYRARDEELGRIVALKILAPELADNPILVERFRREARAAGRLNHKNIVTLYECGQADGHHYLAMEFIDGIDLAEYICRKGQLDPEEARRILIQACKALEHALEQDITHRDIKPSNFLLANDEGRTRVKLTDMGLSRINTETDFQITRAGTTVGTVDYMAPEQARDSSLADIRSDIYSLGCTFYHMLAGHPPFDEGGIGERVYKHIAADPPDVRAFNEKVSAGLWTVLRRMLAKHPDDRFQTPTDVIAALRSAGESATPTPTPPPRETSAVTVNRDHPTPVTPTPVVQPSREPAPRQEATSRKRESPAIELKITPDETAVPGITTEMRSAAAAQFAHATEVVRSGGDPTYAQQLLLSCCKLDPANLMYRRMLREVNRDIAKTRKAGWFGSLANLPARGRLKKAKNANDPRAILECGEELLCRVSNDVQAQIDMAQAAEALGLLSLAVWLLEEARSQDIRSVVVLRALAGVLERQNRLKLAIGIWERIKTLVPDDREAADKIRELSVNETLARGGFRS